MVALLALGSAYAADEGDVTEGKDSEGQAMPVMISYSKLNIDPDEYPAETLVGLSPRALPHGWSVAKAGATGIPVPSEAKFKWQFNFHFKKPKSVLVKLPGEEKAELFWYIKFTLINRTGKTRNFDPEMQLFTNTGQLITAGEGFNSRPVFEKVKKITNNPLLVDLNTATGKVLEGEDNGIESIAVFRNFDEKAGKFDLFIGGLSGETATIKLPKPIKVKKEVPFDPKDVDAKGEMVEATKTVETSELILSKTLRLSFDISGQAKDRENSEVKFTGKEWVMR